MKLHIHNRHLYLVHPRRNLVVLREKNTRRIFSHFSRHIFFSLLENDESERDTNIISDSSFVLSRVVVFCEHSLVVVVENEREEQTVCVVFEEKGERVKRKCFEAKARR